MMEQKFLFRSNVDRALPHVGQASYWMLMLFSRSSDRSSLCRAATVQRRQQASWQCFLRVCFQVLAKPRVLFSQRMSEAFLFAHSQTMSKCEGFK